MSKYNEACDKCQLRKKHEKLLIGEGFWGRKCAVLEQKDRELRKIVMKLAVTLLQITKDEEKMGTTIHTPDILDVLEDIKARMESL